MKDPDCLGPCHDSESKYTGCIPGQANQPCIKDCYFDQDSGSGNDECYWDHRCDPYGTNGAEGNECAYTCDTCSNMSTYTSRGACIQGCNDTPPALLATCAERYNTQPTQCNDYCGPLTPNGCDCFGCCELPAGSGKWVYLGSTSDNSGGCDTGTCTRDTVSDPALCKPCTPVAACLNTCEACELCLGKTTLPPECYPDAGSGGSGGSGGSTGGSAGSSTCPTPLCPAGVQSCGLDCLPNCPQGYFCNTGCCTAVPK